MAKSSGISGSGSTQTRQIGLSLGADICWAAAYEDILKRLDLAIPMGNDEIRFEVSRVTIEPFDLKQPVRYDLVVDRLTHWMHTSREWIKKAVIMDGLYVLNNPWSLQSMEKHTTSAAMMKLGLPATCRASFSFYNTLEEADQFIQALKDARTFFARKKKGGHL